MLSYITGTLEDISEHFIVIESAGIGFEIQTFDSVIRNLPELHKKVKLYVYLQILEDERKLYGFISKNDKELFLKLISVSGVGPKGACSILNTLSADEIVYSVISGDYKAISAANGIGQKTAQRIVVDLKDKLHAEDYGTDGVEFASTDAYSSVSNVVAALVNLGYSNQEALKAVRKINGADQMEEEDLLKSALKSIY